MTVANILIEALERRLAEIQVELDAIPAAAEAETRAITPDENIRIDELLAERDAGFARLDTLRAQSARAAQALTASTQVTSEPNPVYRRDDPGASFFKDLVRSRLRGDVEARDRLVRSQETRAQSTANAWGGTFAPPLWLVDEYVALARAGRVTADAMTHQELPSGVSSINLPRITTGAATGVQSTQNTALASADMGTDVVTGTITTIGGKSIVSQQLMDQSGIPFDRVILGDLARSYAQQVGALVVTQLAAVTGAIAVPVTATTLTGSGSLYSGIANAYSQIWAARFDSPTVIIMHPRRWATLLDAVDSAGRPLVPIAGSGQGFNVLGQAGAGAPQQTVVGNLQGLPVLTDPNIPTNLGTGTDQDEVFVVKADDLWLFESALQAESFDATYADQASILFRVLGYVAPVLNRFSKSIAVLGGAGLETPTF